MDLKLHGKSALVSGSTAGIGFAIAQRAVRFAQSLKDWHKKAHQLLLLDVLLNEWNRQ